VDPFQVAEALGVHVAEDRLDPDTSGILQLRKNSRPLIILNIGDGVRRKRFTCAHELGHYVKRQDEDWLEHVDYRDEAASLGVDSDEKFANGFAASLLMPEHLVEQRVGVGEGEAEMADHFRVSEAALVNRLKSLGLYKR
jgi:Zn-dependent peptidase ImmA (M78 family)